MKALRTLHTAQYLERRRRTTSWLRRVEKARRRAQRLMSRLAPVKPPPDDYLIGDMSWAFQAHKLDS